jgi:hypothetical protein
VTQKRAKDSRMETARAVVEELMSRSSKANLIPLMEIRYFDRVYRYPEDFPAAVIERFIELVANDEITTNELNYLHLVLIGLPRMAAEMDKSSFLFSGRENKEFAEIGLSFSEYVDYQIERMKRQAENSIGRRFSRRIMELLLSFRNLDK